MIHLVYGENTPLNKLINLVNVTKVIYPLKYLIMRNIFHIAMKIKILKFMILITLRLLKNFN